MAKSLGLSRHQKRAVKFLTDTLGTETPFSYEKTQTNHLKVLIDGVERPIYTSSTPSDSKSFNNFSAEVKRELKAVAQRAADVNDDAEQPTAHLKPVSVQFQAEKEKLIQGCVKSFRSRLSALKSREEQLYLESKDPDSIVELRKDAVKQALRYGVQARKQIGYLKPSHKKEIEKTLTKHLNFMLPSLAEYSTQLVADKNVQALVTQTPYDALDSTAVPECIDVGSNDEQFHAPETAIRAAETSTNNPADKLMRMGHSDRINALRELPRSLSCQLVEDTEHAIALNREQDIESVVRLIQTKQLPLEMIISRLEAS